MTPRTIPREKIPWYPTINFDACTGDQECLNFCKNDVFTWDAVESHPIVERPYNCAVGCDACSQVCPAQAITFPSPEDLRQTLRRLRAEAIAGGNGTG